MIPPHRHDPRYPAVCLDASRLGLEVAGTPSEQVGGTYLPEQVAGTPLEQVGGTPLEREPPPLPDLRAVAGVTILCPEPVHHARQYAELHRWLAALQLRAPGVPVHLWLRCALETLTPFRALPGIRAREQIHRLPTLGPTTDLRPLLATLRQPGPPPRGQAWILGESDEDWPGWLAAAGHRPALLHPLGYRADAFPEDPHDPGRLATDAFHQALRAASPRWVTAPGTVFPLRIDLPHPRFLLHQSRFHLGDALWLTPLLRGVKRKFPGAHTTVVGGPEVVRALDRNPHVDTLLPYRPEAGAQEERRIAGSLARHRFDAALMALIRRPKSRWLARAVAEMEIPHRINLEYFDTAEDGRQPLEGFSAEGWFFWGTVTSPRLLLHALAPFLEASEGALLEDRRLVYARRPEAEVEAERRLMERGIQGPFVLLAPAAHSSQRWPAAHFGALAAAIHRELGLAVLVEGAPDEAELVAQVVAAAGLPAVMGALDPLPVLVALLTRAAFLVANDSAPIHLAETTGTPTLYFAHHEKLPHSHPAATESGAPWALFDGRNNRLREIPVEPALAALRRFSQNKAVQLRL